jgi:23S rRNA-/tRNA-specific pseudouridylate synthase
MGTSGLLVMPRRAVIQCALSWLFATRKVVRRYVAVRAACRLLEESDLSVRSLWGCYESCLAATANEV